MIIYLCMESASKEIKISGLEPHKPASKTAKIVALVVANILVFVMVFASAGYIQNRNRATVAKDNTLRILGENIALTRTTEEEPTPSLTPEIVKHINPFNGLELSDTQLAQIKNHPLAVMIDNSTPGRKNHNNINRADMVYEAVTEYGITRFMPIFYSDQSDFRVMPVRSVRMHFMKNFLEYPGAVIYHVGGAYTPKEPKTNVVQKIFDEKIQSLYYYKHAPSPILSEIYEPKCTEDPGIPGYSCKYQTTQTLWKKATEVGYQQTKWEEDNNYDWKWKFGETTANTSDKPATNITYMFAGHKEFEANWTYYADKDVYLRKTAGQIHMDKAMNEQIKTTTLIVQKVKHNLQVDEKGRAILDTEGTGEANVFEKGKMYDVTWKKVCPDCRTRYFDKANGEEFTFQPGRIWVSITRDVEKINIS